MKVFKYVELSLLTGLN